MPGAPDHSHQDAATTTASARIAAPVPNSARRDSERAGDHPGQRLASRPDDLKRAQRARHVLQPLAAAIDERNRQLGADLVAHRGRNVDAARLGERLQPGGDIDAVAQQIVALDDDIAEVDTDAEAQPLALGALRVLRRDRPLDREGAFDRIDGAREIGEDAVPGGCEDAAAILRRSAGR